DYLRRRELDNTSIRILDMDLAASQKSNVRVHAIFEPHSGLHMSGPAESGRINRTLNARGASANDVERNSADFPVLGIFHRGEQLVNAFHILVPSDCIRNPRQRRNGNPPTAR